MGDILSFSDTLLGDVGIWSLAYEVEPTLWKGNTMPLVERAINALSILDLEEIGDRPVVFITHSMGGLLVKQMLRHALDFNNPRWQKIVEQTKGIVFLSTPHSGADLASWTQYIDRIIGATVSLKELQAHDSRLLELNEVYRNQQRLSQIPIEVYYEKEKTMGFLVVNSTSANPGIPGVTPIPLDYNHISISKPGSRKEPLYRRVKRFVGECLPNNLLPPLHSMDRIPQEEVISVDSQPSEAQNVTKNIYIERGNYNESIGRDYNEINNNPPTSDPETKKKI